MVKVLSEIGLLRSGRNLASKAAERALPYATLLKLAGRALVPPSGSRDSGLREGTKVV
jgi:hypothetical protein